jgi:hypothetical protein
LKPWTTRFVPRVEANSTVGVIGPELVAKTDEGSATLLLWYTYPPLRGTRAPAPGEATGWNMTSWPVAYGTTDASDAFGPPGR